MVGLIKQAIALNEAGIKPVTPTPKLPPDFAAAMKKNSNAIQHYKNFTPARKWRYVNWITKAKRSQTRASKFAQRLK